MSALIKGSDDRGLRRVTPVMSFVETLPHPSPIDVPSDEQLRILELEKALREARSDHLAAQQQHAIDLESGRQSARAEGVAAGRRESEVLLAALTKAANDARTSASKALVETSTTALAMARAALSKVLGDREQWPAMIAEILTQRSAQIDAALVLHVRVSAVDFPDTDALHRIAEANAAAIDLIADPNLASGSCLFELRLGEMEVGPAMQGRKLLELFDDLVTRGDRA